MLLSGSEHEGYWFALPFASDVYLGGEPSSASAKRLHFLAYRPSLFWVPLFAPAALW